MARTCRGLTAPTTSAPRHWNAESGQQQDLTPKDSERSHGPRRSANVGVPLRRVHERRGSQARDSGVSQHWGAGAVPGPGFESGKRFFCGVSSHAPPKREKESGGCPPPLHPPPAGMQAYAVACMPQSTRRRLRSHRRLLFREVRSFKRRFANKGVRSFKGRFAKKGCSAPTAGRASRRAFGRAGFDKIWRDFSVVQHASASRHGGAPAAGLAASRQ